MMRAACLKRGFGMIRSDASSISNRRGLLNLNYSIVQNGNECVNHFKYPVARYSHHEHHTNRCTVRDYSFLSTPFDDISCSNRKDSYHQCTIYSRSYSNEKHSLEMDTEHFLNNFKDMNSSQKTRQIQHLTHKWGTLWSKKTLPKNFFKTNHNLNNNRNKIGNSKNIDQIANGIQYVDKLVHILLDTIETETSKGLKEVKSLTSKKQSKFNHPNSKRITGRYDVVYNIALRGWAKAGIHIPSISNMAASKAQTILDRMEAIYDAIYDTSPNKDNEDIIQDIRPHTILYDIVIPAWASSSDDKDGAMRAFELLQHMEDLALTGKNPFAKPSQLTYNGCVHGFAKRGMLPEAEMLLDTMEQKYNATATTNQHQHNNNDYDNTTNNIPDPIICPDVVTYTCIMNAYGKAKIKDAANKAEELLFKMMEMYDRTGNDQVKPNAVTYGTVISLHARSRSKNGAQNADRLLQWLINSQKKVSMELNTNDLNTDDSEYNFDPSNDIVTAHFLTVMLAYSRRRSNDAAPNVERLLMQMENMYQAGNQNVKPNIKCFITCLDAWAKSGEKGAAIRAEKILNRLEKLLINSSNDSMSLNNYAYNTVIDAWARSGEKEASARVDIILDRMNDLYITTQNEAFRPDKITYTSLIRMWTRNKEEEFDSKCARLLSHMEQEYFKGNKRMEPDVILYANVIEAFAKAHKPKLAEVVLDRIEKLYKDGKIRFQPNIVCFNIVMNAYAQSNSQNNADETLRIFQRIKQAQNSENINLVPTVVTFSTCLNGLARSNEGDMVTSAESIISEMCQISTIDLKYTTDAWNSLILFYSRSKLHDKCKRALNVIHRMQDFDVELNLTSYNLVLDASLNAEPTTEAIRTDALNNAIYIFNTLRESRHLNPNSITYNSLLRICDKLIIDDEEREKAIIHAFESCCSEGMVNDTILRTMRKISSHDLYRKTLGKYDTNRDAMLNSLPTDWVQNSGYTKRLSNIIWDQGFKT